MKEYVSTLDLASTEDLLNELEERFDHYIFMGLRVCDTKGNTTTAGWCGEEYTCKGLVFSMIEKISEDSAIINGVEEEPEEEDYS